MNHIINLNDTEGVVRIAVVGAGGNGAQIVSGLARLHMALQALGHSGLSVTLFDPDTVSPANIGRQLYFPSDIGQHKAIVLINRINMAYHLDWSARPTLFPSEGYSEIVIGCVDSIKSRREIFKNANGRYWLDLGNDKTTGQVILGEIHNDPETRLPHVLEFFPKMNRSTTKESDTPSCSVAEALQKQDLFVNQGIATWALHLLWTLLRNKSITHHGYFINLTSGRVTPIPVDPDYWKQAGVKRIRRKR